MSTSTLTAPAATAVDVEITAPLGAFRDALDRAAVAVSARPLMAVLQCVRLTATPGEFGTSPRLALYATDVDRAIDVTLVEDPEAEGASALAVSGPADVALPAATLKAALAHADADAITFRIRTGRQTELRVGKAKYKIADLPGNHMPEFKELPHPLARTVTAGALQRAVRRVSYATSTEKSRPIIQGVVFEPTPDGSGVTVAALDGSRGAQVTLPELRGLTAEAIVPRSAAEALTNVFDPHELVAVQADEGVLVVSSATRRLRTRLIEGPFPAWRQHLRTDAPITATVDREALARAIRRVAFLADTDMQRLALAFRPAPGTDGTDPEAWTCELRAITADRGTATDVVACAFRGTDLPFTIGCAAGYLLGALTKTVAGERAVLALQTPRMPFLVTDPADPHALAMVGPLNVPTHTEE